MAHKFLFSGESGAGGLIYLYGKSLSNGRIYRWEPPATKLRGEEAAAFRRKAEARHRSLSAYSQTVGILKVEGPVAYQEKMLIGWEAVPGEPLLTQFPLTLPLAERIKRLKPIIHSYRRFHALGLVVGPPDWKRIYLGEKAIFTPDPFLLNYLNSPLVSLPSGLANCHPPESFAGKPLTQQGDLFFLGLLIYLFCTGHLPYPLVNAWPTSALLNGEVIPPALFCPDLPPELVGLMVRLLAVTPEARPSAVELEEYWEKSAAMTLLPSTATAAIEGGHHPVEQTKEYQRWRRQKIAQGLVSRWPRRVSETLKAYDKGRNHRRKGVVVTFVVCGLFLIGGVLFRTPEKRTAPAVTMVVQELLTQMSAPTFPGYPLSNRPELWADLATAKEERVAAATKLLAQPVIEVEAVRELRKEPNWAQLEVSLVWRRWTDNHWQISKTKEVLVLERKGKQWEITARAGQEEN